MAVIIEETPEIREGTEEAPRINNHIPEEETSVQKADEDERA